MGWTDIIRGRPTIPAALGAELEPFPYLSGFGLVHRITRLTCSLPSHVSQLGFRNRKVADVLQATQRPGKPRDALLRVLGLQATALAAYWSPEPWCPVQPQDLFQRQPRPVRRCPDCARYGYHCTLFQLPSITRCPWHGCRLEQQCSQCGHALWAGFDQKGWLGRCGCGDDLFDPVVASADMWTFPGAGAQAWIEDYLAWALRRRPSRWLCTPLSNLHWDAGFAALAAPPARLQTFEHGHVRPIELYSGAGVDPAPRQFWGWALWGGERPLTIAPLPATVYPKLCAATKDVVDALPGMLRTPVELAEAHNLPPGASLRENVLLRPDCFIAPHGRSGAVTWLNLSTVDAGLAAFCGQALDDAATHLSPARTYEDRSLQAERSNAMDRLQGRRHLSFALEDLLARAYRQGLQATLRTTLGLARSTSRPSMAPVLELVGQTGRLRAVRVCWAAGHRAQRPEQLQGPSGRNEDLTRPLHTLQEEPDPSRLS
ncbi:hypothetical protein FHY12_000201 [Xanthomonas arboricola]|uniref:hypothetical protein n=1 Tax=Xanthomonas euroxanthea TaxID=2259622 RepID=UPI00141B1F7A|nr:hypothetical protein [Xanthomonas euroxanthea]MBB3814756.1 hypothetical protein [Xanthomonas euroxanthea]NIK07718.1 hypothetical protein [Xanthomonas euroxanthea]NIK37916.1 hypothetical protein [Xanthomonas euroxanthea]